MTFEPGYYNAIHVDGSRFIVFLEDGLWFTVGIDEPIDLDTRQIVSRVPDTEPVVN